MRWKTASKEARNMTSNSLNNKVALITGAARRIGADVARTLHAAGANVVLHYNTSKQEAMQLCDQLNQARSQSAVVMQANLQDQTSASKLVQDAAKAWGKLDILINNASRFYQTHLDNVTETAWNDLFDSNLKAPYFLAISAAPLLKVAKGVIINIADVHGERPLRNYSVYCLTKAGLLMMTKALAKELSPDVRVNAVSPGSVIWPEGKNTLTDAQKQTIISKIPLGRSGNATDIANTVLYLVRDANYVTGQVIRVDGGRVM